MNLSMERVPWISVIIPAYNGERYLKDALESLVSQNDVSFEVIVVDDGSEDNTVSIAEGYCDRLLLTLVALRHSGNWVANTNLALKIACGEYVSFLHQDDVWCPGRLKQLKKTVDRWPEEIFFFHPVQYMDSAGRETGVLTPPFEAREKKISASNMLSKLVVQNFIAVSGVCFKKGVIQKVGFLDEELWYTADWKLWLNLSAVGGSVYIPSVLSGFRLHNTSLTASGARNPAEFSHQMQKVVDQIFPMLECHGVDIGGVKRLAEFSVEVNTMLASAACGKIFNISRVFIKGRRIGPRGLLKYVRCSRILERSLARIKAGIAPGIHYNR